MLTSKTARVLEVDLGTESASVLELPENTNRKYLGGSGLAAKILWDQTDANTQALSEENRLVFMTGALTGTPVPMTTRLLIAGISPLTNIWGEAHNGGTFAHALRHAGYDGVVFHGKAKTPVYLWLKNGTARIVGAGHLWGKDTYEVDELLKKETDPKSSVVTIGRAGERLVRFAAVMSDGPAARAAARCGMGAVMGFKNLKAIVATGSTPPTIHDRQGLRESIKEHFPKTTHFNPTELKQRITGLYKGRGLGGDTSPIKNWQLGNFEGFGEKMAEFMASDAVPNPCRGCPARCLQTRVHNGQRHANGEFLVTCGCNCLVDNMETLTKIFELCNRYGMDGISLGNVIAFAMELYDRGLITKTDTGGIELTWGNDAAVFEVARLIGEAEGVGKLLGQGVRGLAQTVGGMAHEYAVHIKGMDPSMHDPRSTNRYALQAATANRGADHLDGMVALFHPGYASLYLTDKDALEADRDRFAVKGVGKLTAWSQDYDCLIDSLGMCKLFYSHATSWLSRVPESFRGIQPSHLLEWSNQVNGFDMELKEFMRVGERVFNLKRMFNVRRGVSRKDDLLPPRLLTHKRRGTGISAENLPPMGPMLSEYYACRGWTEEGIPTREKLAELELDEVLSARLPKY